jgi:hypothetical protein
MTAADAWGVTDARAVVEAVVDVLEERGLVTTAARHRGCSARLRSLSC